jgi:Zn-dependent peptidase ImmA (M78 family)/transcriptional regulator with XRE-family HTH domain
MDAVNPAMITLAREAHGLTQGALAEAISVTQGKISKYENGMLSVSTRDLEKIAKILGFIPEFFRQQKRIYGLGHGSLFHRTRQQVPISLQKKVQAQINIRRLQIDRLLQSAHIEAERSFPVLDIDEFDGDAEKVASYVRAEWHLPMGPVDNLMAAIEAAGGIIVPCDFGTLRLDAKHLWVPESPPLFFVNRRSPGDRLRFTLAHEMGHAIMHHTAPIGDVESQADSFSAALLMPAREIRRQLEGMTLRKAAALKPVWKVAMQALIRRAYDLGVIDRNAYSSLFRTLSSRGQRTNEPIQIPAEQPTVFAQLVAVHQQQLGYRDDDMVRVMFTDDPDYYPSEFEPVTFKFKGKRISTVLGRGGRIRGTQY